MLDLTIKKFLKMESDHNLYDLKINDEYIWNYLRYEIYEEIAYKGKTLERIQIKTLKKKQWLKTVKYLLLRYIIPLIKFTPRRLKDSNIIIFNYSLYKNSDDKLINELSYPLTNIIKNYKVSVCDAFGMAKQLNCYKEKVIDIRPLYLRARIRSIFRKISKTEVKAIEYIAKVVFDTFEHKLNSKNYLSKTKFSMVYLNKWQKILSKSKAKIIIYSNNGNMMQVLRAAKLNNKIVLDFQHSIISNYNILYNSIKHKNKVYNVDYIVTWGKNWKNNMKSDSIICPFGSISKFIKHNDDNNVPSNYKNNIIIIGDKKNRQLLAGIAVQLSKILQQKTIYYKLRPEENSHWKTLFNEDFKDNKKLLIIDNDKHSLEYYLKSCKYIIGIDSTLMLEGIFQGQTAIFIKDEFGSHLEYESFYKNGYGMLVNNVDEIANIININCSVNQNFCLEHYVKEFDERSFNELIQQLIN